MDTCRAVGEDPRCDARLRRWFRAGGQGVNLAPANRSRYQPPVFATRDALLASRGAFARQLHAGAGAAAASDRDEATLREIKAGVPAHVSPAGGPAWCRGRTALLTFWSPCCWTGEGPLE